MEFKVLEKLEGNEPKELVEKTLSEILRVFKEVSKDDLEIPDFSQIGSSLSDYLLGATRDSAPLSEFLEGIKKKIGSSGTEEDDLCFERKILDWFNSSLDLVLQEEGDYSQTSQIMLQRLKDLKMTSSMTLLFITKTMGLFNELRDYNPETPIEEDVEYGDLTRRSEILKEIWGKFRKLSNQVGGVEGPQGTRNIGAFAEKFFTGIFTTYQNESRNL